MSSEGPPQEGRSGSESCIGPRGPPSARAFLSIHVLNVETGICRQTVPRVIHSVMATKRTITLDMDAREHDRFVDELRRLAELFD